MAAANGDTARIGALIRAGVDRWFGHEGEHWLQLHHIRKREGKLAPTWLAALAAGGIDLDEASRAEIAVTRARQAANVALTRELSATWPGVTILKGHSIARLYPDDIPRYMGDIDAACPDPDTVYAIATVLLDRGWQPATLLIYTGPRERLDVQVTLSRVIDSPQRPLTVELASTQWMGNRLGVAPRAGTAGTSMATTLTALAAEGLDRPFGFRDALDFHLVLARAGERDLDEFVCMADETDLTPEAGKLVSAVMWATEAGPRVTDLARRLTPRPARRRRVRRAAALVAHPRWGPARLAQHLFLYRDNHPWWGRALPRLVGRVPGLAAARHGLIAWGIPVHRVAPTSAPDRTGDHLLSTPIGEWFMTATPDVDPNLLERLGLEPSTG